MMLKSETTQRSDIDFLDALLLIIMKTYENIMSKIGWILSMISVCCQRLT